MASWMRGKSRKRFDADIISQTDAVLDSLTREIALIQGPPGTGKVSYSPCCGVELTRARRSLESNSFVCCSPTMLGESTDTDESDISPIDDKIRIALLRRVQLLGSTTTGK